MPQNTNTGRANSSDKSHGPITVRMKNIGGIAKTDITIEPGVAVLTGRNATNRTSFLTGLTDVLGGAPATLKSDAELGYIELDIGDTTYTKEYSRDSGSLVSQGKEYTDHGELVELFASLLADNPVRQAVERGDDLREILMRPVDTAEIEAEISKYQRERTHVDNELEEIKEKLKQQPELEKERQTLIERIDAVEEEIADVQKRINSYNADEQETQQAEELLQELEGLRRSLRDCEEKIEDRKAELERLKQNRREVEAALDEISVPANEIETVETNLEQSQQEKRALVERIDDLQRIVSFNEELLENGLEGVDLQTDSSPEVAASLNPQSQEVTCWTCGSTVKQDEISTRLDELRTVVQEHRSRERELTNEIDELQQRKQTLDQSKEKKRTLETNRTRLKQQIELQQDELTELREERGELEDQLAVIEEQVAETEELRESDLAEAYQELSALEYERGQIETELSRVEDKLERIESLKDEQEQLQQRRETISAELVSLQSRIDDLEAEAVKQINTHMDTVLDLLNYDNVERIWIELKESQERNGSESKFVLHVVRETADETVYEDSLATLSESERTVVGLVVALAGYLVHDVHETVPFMLLDSLEAIDSDRIAALVEYVSDFVPFLVVALLPEDTTALASDYQRITVDALT